LLDVNSPEGSPLNKIINIEETTEEELNSISSAKANGMQPNITNFYVDNNTFPDGIEAGDLLKIHYVPIQANKGARHMAMILKTEKLSIGNQDFTIFKNSIDKFRAKMPTTNEEFLLHLKRLFKTMYAMSPKFSFST